jgi:hypothetical protein
MLASHTYPRGPLRDLPILGGVEAVFVERPNLALQRWGVERESPDHCDHPQDEVRASWLRGSTG